MMHTPRHPMVEENRKRSRWFFRAPIPPDGAGGAQNDSESALQEEPASDDGDPLCCRACGRIITRTGHRTEVDGAHQHTFANPHGIVFQIGCFKDATGCALAGPATDDFTWFKGFAWRVAVCGSCLTHMGWMYVSSSGASFFGLILDRLVACP
ncbi:MAG: hypothetical protein JRI76_09240 [Deltaproteobacteria bacterium]|nr:hypothetical protein [Deltaproteobacteria bacterium]MBW2133497.1 hypothetical protein [Deltaproteobacteria bacterium]